ncbi:ABC transporter ATP-binding protein [Lacticaseibacillus zhaodongensis]|uniref:ABC transporter ATP-binding protein n=1 Tax=Lacticaseibacillus zhaodongensis TaxID=2668065 RepID=UPI0012D360FB|nr:ATP-binding cassette domain-containing protein [Lacticaseibacillus zhaodongensis]
MINANQISFHYTSFEKTPGLAGTLKDMFHRDKEDIQVLTDFDFAVQDGEMVGLMGPNGAGKTTLIKLLTGILTPNQGDVLVDGAKPSIHSKSFLSEIGVLFGQKSQLAWDLPPADTYNMLAQIYKLSPQEYKTRRAALVEMLNVSEFINRPVRKLSLGQRMRCELIAALIHSPKYLFLDEPTLGLDLPTQKSIYRFLKKENETNGTTILVTSHNLQDIEEIAERVMVMIKGRIVYNGAPDKLPMNSNSFQEFTIVARDQADNEYTVKATTDNVDEKVAAIGYQNVVSITRDGTDFESFILNLYENGGVQK